jgi:hypothetical protein
VDVEVRRDSQGTSVGLILLAVLGSLGLAGSALAGVGPLLEGDPVPLMVLGSILLVLVLAATGIMYWRTRGRPEARGFGRVIIGTLALTGALIAVWVVVIAALVIFLFVACLAGGAHR